MALPVHSVRLRCTGTGVAERVEALKGEFVVQQYVEHPLLVNERKVNSLPSNNASVVLLLVTILLFRIMCIVYMSKLCRLPYSSLIV